jgi:preprotein translocase subunit SecE
MAKVSIQQFAKQVRQEALKVTWPSRKETVVSTVMVMAMVVLAAIFFFLVDQVLSMAVRLVFGVGA